MPFDVTLAVLTGGPDSPAALGGERPRQEVSPVPVTRVSR